MVKCDICKKEFKNQQGLTGHMRFVHGIKSDKQAPLFPPKRFITDEMLAVSLASVMEKIIDLYKFRDEQYLVNEACLKSLKSLAKRVAE